MNAETARGLIALYRPGKSMDARILKAVRFAEGDPAMSPALNEQMDFDEHFTGMIGAIQPPADFALRLTIAAVPVASRARQVLNPAILGALVGVVLLVGFAVFQMREAEGEFPGREWAESFIEINGGMSGAELERTQFTAGQLGDNMMLRGFDGFALPPEIAALPAAGWRVFRHGQSGHKVAQIAFERQNLIVFVFRTADFGVQCGAEGEWRTFTHKEWAAAISGRGALCTLLSFPGDAAAMDSFLKSLKP